MNIDITFLTKLFEEIGILSTVFIGTATIIVGGFFKIKKLIISHREKHHGAKLLTNHFYFKRMRFYLYSYISNLDFKQTDIKREYASKTFIYDKIYTFYKVMLPLAKEIEETNELKSIGGIDNILDVVYKGVIEYEEAALNHGVPKVFITKFAKYHKNQVDSVSESITSILANSLYSSIEERFSAILDILIGAFTMIMPHINETLNSLNGNLTKVLENMSDTEFVRLKIYSKRRLK